MVNTVSCRKLSKSPKKPHFPQKSRILAQKPHFTPGHSPRASPFGQKSLPAAARRETAGEYAAEKSSPMSQKDYFLDNMVKCTYNGRGLEQ
jgi:hypothetical protein